MSGSAAVSRGRLVGAEVISTLATLLRGEDDRWPLLLLGAGASFRSGVPVADESVKRIARIVYSELKLAGSRPPERVKLSEWEPWLKAQSWYPREAESLGDSFPATVENLLKPAEFRKRVLLEIMQPENGISAGYGILADFVMRGLVRTILTTNFDSCLPTALMLRPHIRHIAEINRTPGNYTDFDVFNKCQIVWLHGKAENYSDKNSLGETGFLDGDLVQLLRPLLRSSPIIVLGYRGAESSIMNGLFGQSESGRLDFKNGIYWCTRKGDNVHAKVFELADRVGSNFTFLEIAGFDETLQEVSRQLIGIDRFTGGHSSPGLTQLSFDEQIVSGASLNDLDLDLALTTLSVYCKQLGRSAPSSNTLPLLLREQGLTAQTASGTDAITNGALLLFGHNPQAFLPQAVVAFTEAGKKREIYGGNLMQQHRQLLAKLESTDVNPLIKLKLRRSHDERQGFHPRALVELLVNLLVHRDYSIERSASIDLQPGYQIVFQNPGALPTAMAQNVTVGKDGRVEVHRQFTDPRNASLCDVFFGTRSMEREGTGLIDVKKLMLEIGGSAEYIESKREASFTAALQQAPLSAGSTRVALSTHPTGIYTLNLMPFSFLPSEISVVKLKMRLAQRASNIDMAGLGCFVERGQDSAELWSFAPLSELLRLLDPIAEAEKSFVVGRAELENDADSRRVLSWLLRNHLEAYLSAFVDQGLMLEGKRSHRAYFFGDGKNRTVTWDSPQKRGNKREVVKCRSEERPWFENEGFGYEVVNIANKWFLRIKPFYMFTGADAKTPLPSFARVAKATRRMKWDKNKNVETDLVFWSVFLARTGSTMNLAAASGYDLIIDCTYLTLEVLEPK